MERKIVAIIGVDDDTAFEKIDDGPVPYLEKEFGWLEQSGIFLKDCFIADDDEDDKWKAYLNYLVEWAFNHQGEEFAGMTPACYDEFCENECPLGGDSTNDCEGCADSGDYHCVNGECVARPIGCPACRGNDKIYPGALKALGVPHTKHCPACGEELSEDV